LPTLSRLQSCTLKSSVFLAMRKIILNVAVSLDGFIEDANGSYDWCLTDQDYGMTDFFSHVDTMFIGRKSYELLINADDRHVFPGIKKYVFSDTLAQTQYQEIEVVPRAKFAEAVKEIRELPGGDIWLFGGADLVSAFVSNNLIDELLLAIHPVILSSGKPLFKDLKERINLELIDSKTYDTGLIQARYLKKAGI